MSDLPVTMHVPLWQRLLDWVWALLAAVGLVATVVCAGLYAGGFFHWLAGVSPEGSLLVSLFGGAR